MVPYPISIDRVGYRGNDPNKRAKAARENKTAADLEKAINDLLLKQERPVQSYLYHEIASITGYSVETVRKFGFSIDCGHNGFTVIRRGLSREEAMRSFYGEDK